MISGVLCLQGKRCKNLRPLTRRNTSFQGECKETRDWESGIRIGDRGISGRGSHVGRRTKLWEIRGEKQKRNQEIRNRTKTRNGDYG